jgi:hypothetical protein
MTHGAMAMKYQLVALTLVSVLLAQMNSYNGGIPITPGTSVPESNPATVAPPPRSSVPSSSPADSPTFGSNRGVSSAPAGPAYSFGAAPPPVVGPSH